MMQQSHLWSRLIRHAKRVLLGPLLHWAFQTSVAREEYGKCTSFLWVFFVCLLSFYIYNAGHYIRRGIGTMSINIPIKTMIPALIHKFAGFSKADNQIIASREWAEFLKPFPLMTPFCGLSSNKWKPTVAAGGRMMSKCRRLSTISLEVWEQCFSLQGEAPLTRVAAVSQPPHRPSDHAAVVLNPFCPF